LTAALDSGLPIVASRLGAFIERLSDRANAVLLPWHSAPSQWNDSLMALATSGEHLPAPVSTHAQEAASAYRDRYLSALPQRVAPSGDAQWDDSHYTPPAALASEKAYTLAELYVAGIENGEAEARREFKRRATQVEEDLAAARQSSINAHRALQQRDDDYQQSQRTLQAEYQRYQVLQEQAEALVQQRQLLEQDIDLLEENRLALLHHRDSLEQELADTRRVLMESRQTLEHERDAARAAFDEVVRSRSWKITAPLRRSIQVLKSLRHRGRDLRANTRRLPQQVALASQILKQEGPQALTRRVYEKLTKNRELPAPSAPARYHLQTAIGPLTVPTSATPRFSIIIPVYGQHLLTYTCLHSIAATCAALSIEVIVIDDCSPEPAAEALREVAGVTIVRNDTNLGFLRNCNKAAQLARGEYIVLLNNDTIVTGDWLREMQAVFANQPDAGLVGVKLIYPDGKLQEAGGIVWRDGSAWNLGRDGDPDRPEYNFLREVDYCSGACLMIPRDFWNQLGGFDDIYAPAYYEDTDLAFRVRQAGRRVFYQPRAVVVHFEGKSSGTDVTQGIKRYQVINHETFIKRWREVLSTHRLNGMMPHLERERYQQPRVLVIDACMLTPDQDSGSLRMFEMLGILRRMGCKVTFFADNLEYRQPYTQQIQDLGVEVLYHPYHSYMTELLTQVAADFDAIVVSRVTVACKYVDLIRKVAPQARLIFDTVDLHFLRQERQAALTPDPMLQAAASAMKQQELQIMAQSDITLVVSPVEQALLKDLVPDVRVGIVSNIHETMPGPAGFAERKGILFIGGFRHPPNLDAINWYVENVLPILRQKQPGLVTTIIGSNAPPALEKFAADDFVIAGFVPDVTPYYHQARLSISPLRYGAGVKGKVNLSMQYGVPVVATPMSVEGMFLTDGENVMVADSPEDFANAIIRAHSDAALWQKLARGGLENIEQHFSRRCA
ncbi:MAG: glycosyltransferase, partial [Betaproteobacteria bacterium]|nr:glycosyltransferase [Betaproteobacteria bacterium]